MAGVMTESDKERLALANYNRKLEPLESSLISGTNESALVEYLGRQRHTLELIRERAGRADVPLDAKLFQHLHLQVSQLFYLTLKQPHEADPDAVDSALNQIVGSVYAIKVMLAEQQIRRMMGS